MGKGFSRMKSFYEERFEVDWDSEYLFQSEKWLETRMWNLYMVGQCLQGWSGNRGLRNDAG